MLKIRTASHISKDVHEIFEGVGEAKVICTFDNSLIHISPVERSFLTATKGSKHLCQKSRKKTMLVVKKIFKGQRGYDLPNERY